MKDNDLTFNALEIISRAKESLGFRTDARLAEYLRISRPTLSNWISRNSVDLKLLLSKLPEVDYNWLLTGKGRKESRRRLVQSEWVEGEVEVMSGGKTSEPLADRSIPLYAIHAAANLKNVLLNDVQYLQGHLLIPDAPKCDAAIYAQGDSMYPLIKSGDILGYKVISNLDTVVYGEIYLVSYRIDDDDHLVVKYLQRSDVPDCIRLVSYNDNHSPMDLPKKFVLAVAQVKLLVRKLSLL